MLSKKIRNILIFGIIALLFAAVGYWNISPERFLDKPVVQVDDNAIGKTRLQIQGHHRLLLGCLNGHRHERRLRFLDGAWNRRNCLSRPSFVPTNPGAQLIGVNPARARHLGNRHPRLPTCDDQFLLRLRAIDAPTITLVTDDQARPQLRNPI